MILRNGGHAVTAAEGHLNEIYIAVLNNSVSTDYSSEEKEELYSMHRYILGSLVILNSPLSPISLSNLLHISQKDINQTLVDLYAILEVARDQSHPVRLHHPSFRDTLDKKRCTNADVWIDEQQAHRKLADSCIQLLSTSLKENICGVATLGTNIADIERSRVEQCIRPEVQYACLY
jgi:hypothetical protein